MYFRNFSLSEDINELMTSATNQWQPKVILHITAAKQHPDVGTGLTNCSSGAIEKGIPNGSAGRVDTDGHRAMRNKQYYYYY